MEQSIEFRIRRVARDKYDIVMLRGDEVSVKHGVSSTYVCNWAKIMFSSRIGQLGLGSCLNFQSRVKSW